MWVHMAELIAPSTLLSPVGPLKFVKIELVKKLINTCLLILKNILIYCFSPNCDEKKTSIGVNMRLVTRNIVKFGEGIIVN